MQDSELKTLAIAQRKRLTKKAKEKIEELMQFLKAELCDDLGKFYSVSYFRGRVHTDNGLYTNDYNYRRYTLNYFRFVYKDGETTIEGAQSYDFSSPEEVVCISNFVSVEFDQFIAVLESFISSYNHKCEEKDKSIDNLLSISIIKN